MINKKSIILILICTMLCITLTGCSSENQDIKEVYTQTKTENNEQLKEIETEGLGITENGDFVIKLTNKNNKPVYIEDINVRFFDQEGNFVKKVSTWDNYFCIPANSELITFVWGYDENLEQYAKNEIKVLYGNPFYEYFTENFEIKANDTDEQLAVSIINNNNSELDCIKVNVVYLKDGKIVGIEYGISYEEGVEANGGVAYVNVDHPINDDYEDVQYDEFRVYLVSAYKE